MSILSFIGSLFSPISNTVNKLSDNKVARAEIEKDLAEIQAKVTQKMLEYDEKVIELQSKLLDSNAKIQVAESQSQSAFVRLYRPVIISSMFLMIALNSFGVLTNPLPELFIQVFGTAFGVITVAPAATEMGSAIIGKMREKK
jgi:uncharacterized membrane protein